MLLHPWLQSLPEGLQNILRGGYLAVGTFFVLSGFVLARSYAPACWDRASLIRYCAARWARIYPVYMLSLVVMAPIIAGDLRRGVPGDEAALLANYGLVLQGWVANLPVHWNTPAWSLSCELFFYLCFPIAALLLRSLSLKQMGLVIVLTLALPNALSAAGVPAEWKPVFHLGDFLTGMMAARLYPQLERLKERGYWLYLPAVSAAALVVANPHLVPSAVSLNSVLRPFNALLLIGLSLGGGLPVQALSTGPASFLGRASYSMYILHIPVLWWFKRFFTGVWGPSTSALIYMAGVIAISGVVCQRLEEPANRKIRQWVAARLREPGRAARPEQQITSEP